MTSRPHAAPPTSGPTQGLFFDPDTMAALSNTTAMRAALALYQQLSRYSPPTGSSSRQCELVSDAFASGRCALTLGSGRQFKRNQVRSSRHSVWA